MLRCWAHVAERDGRVLSSHTHPWRSAQMQADSERALACPATSQQDPLGRALLIFREASRTSARLCAHVARVLGRDRRSRPRKPRRLEQRRIARPRCAGHHESRTRQPRTRSQQTWHVAAGPAICDTVNEPQPWPRLRFQRHATPRSVSATHNTSAAGDFSCKRG